MSGLVKCEICGEEFRQITNTHLLQHNLTINEYKELYQDATLICDDTRRIRSERISGNNNPSKRSDVKEKISIARMGLKQLSTTGDNNPAKRPDVREKIRLNKLEYWRDPEHREVARVNTQRVHREHPEVWNTDAVKRGFEKKSAKAQGITYDEWEGFVSESSYCPAFNEMCRESNRNKYNRMCFLTGLPEENNVDKNGKQRRLSVHHYDMDKMQGCDGKKWKLVPLCVEWHGRAHTVVWEARITWLLKNVWDKDD